MDFEHVTRPIHFIVAVALAVIGGVFLRWPTWEYMGYIIWVITALLLYFLLVSAARAHELRKIERAHWHIQELAKITAAKNETTVKINKSDLVGNDYSVSIRKVPLDPARLQIFANGILNGRKLRIREWTPLQDGKLMSDNEFRDLIEYLKQPDPENPEIQFVVQRNPGVQNSVYDWTPAGWKWLEDIADRRTLIPVSA